MRTVTRIVGLLALAWTALAQSAEPVVLENPGLRYVISAGAQNVSFVARDTGTDYLRTNAPTPCAWVRLAGAVHPATRAQWGDGRLTLGFGETGVEAVLRLDSRPSCFVLTVEWVRGSEIESLTFLNVPLTVSGLAQDPFGACALSLNLITRVDALPALQRDLRASCESSYGLVGAKVALVAGPTDRMLSLLQSALTDASELPVCRVAGPWAQEIPFNHGSYLFNFGTLTETNLDEWVGMTRRLGFTQIDNHGGGEFFRFGDLELNREKWPEGWDAWRRVVGRLHDAGIGSILHTYAFFIDKRSKYVTPVPDPRLDAFRTFTLAEALTAGATDLVVNEATAGLRTVTGFFEHNSVVLHLDDELVTFTGVSQQAPWRFSGLKRGALGTRAAAHDRGAQARHLKECFGLFVPNPESSLFEEIAANHADVVNRCQFDGVYLDAIDGSSILRGGDACWYWANKFVVEIQKRLQRPVGMEMSAMWHHFWQYRTRWQAWDYPQRGHKRFLDLHAETVAGGLMLPLHFGWWNFQSFDPPQVEPTFPDVMEQVGARLIGWDAGISLTAGVDRDRLRTTPLFRRAADILAACETLRHSRAFDEATRARLREPGREFTLGTNAAGQLRFRRVQSQAQTVARGEPWTLTWPVTNGFAPQPACFRIEALMAVAAPRETNARVVADLGPATSGAWKSTSAEGVAFTWKPEAEAEGFAGVLVATNAGKVPRHAAWVRLERRFAPWLNLKERPALGLEIEGDGSGALVALRLESPPHLAFGAVADRYVRVDFTGRRRVTLVETESSRWSDYAWNDGKSPYNLYRETIDFGAVESISLWLQNLAPHRETKIRVGPIQALPLRPAGVRNPRLTIAGQTVEFPIELASGSWLEGNGPDDCEVFGAKGESLGKVVPRGDWPVLRPGANAWQFSSEAGDGPAPRARVTVFARGEEL